MKNAKFSLNDVKSLKLNEEAIKYLKNKKCEYLNEENRIKCEFWKLIPIFYDFCLQNPEVEPLYNFEYLEIEVKLSHFGREFLKEKEHLLSIREENGQKVIRCKFNELVRNFGEYYDSKYQTVWTPFLDEINIFLKDI